MESLIRKQNTTISRDYVDQDKCLIGITGGSGYIGSSLAKRLASSFDTRLLDIREPKQSLGESVDFQLCDIRNFEETEKALRDVDLVIHTAVVQIPVINEAKRLGYEVNFLGTQNVCRCVDENPRNKGMILSGSWHTIGEKELIGVVDEEFGFRPDKVEDRARLYALSKIGQESIVRFYDEISDKIFGIIRMGTVLGEDMPEKTAANIFIQNGLEGKPLTPYRHSMFRPMLYVDVEDICEAYRSFATTITDGRAEKGCGSLAHIVNVYHPVPVTILDLAKTVKDAIAKLTHNTIDPEIQIIDTGQPPSFDERDNESFKVDTTKALRFLHLKTLRSPRESIEMIVKSRLKSTNAKEAFST